MVARSTLLAAIVALAGCAARQTPAQPLSPAVEAWLHAPQDRDGDGVPDARDRCPDAPEDRDEFADDHGCLDGDNDGDGLRDEADACPAAAEDRDGFEDTDGCPEPDNDADLIADARDRCPDVAENYNGMNDIDGCPDPNAECGWGEPSIRGLLLFEVRSTHVLDPAHRDFLFTSIATLFEAVPDVVLEVEGHASGPAEAARGLALSRERAERVVADLVARGVARERLVPAGYGTLCPLDARQSPRAYPLNRRVNFVVVRLHDQRTTATAGCPRGRRYVPASVGPPRRRE